MKVTDYDQRAEKELILACFCGETHFVIFSYRSFGGDDWYVSVTDEYRTLGGIWGRLKAMWDIFRRGSSHGTEVILNDKDVKSIQEWWEQFDGEPD